MGLMPGKRFGSTFSVSFNSVLVPATIQGVELFYNNADLGAAIPVSVVALRTGIFGYEFDVPTDWQHDDRVAMVVTYTWRGKMYSSFSHVGSVQWNFHDLEFLGFTKSQNMLIDDSPALNRLSLPDGRAVEVTVSNGGANKTAARTDQ